MAASGYDISASVSTSSSATGGNIGATQFGAGGSAGGNNVALIGIIAGALLLGALFFFKFSRRGRRR